MTSSRKRNAPGNQVGLGVSLSEIHQIKAPALAVRGKRARIELVGKDRVENEIEVKTPTFNKIL
jgi:hypothetical protein